MIHNPFTSNTFTEKWSTHFHINKPESSFSFIGGLLFFKHPRLPLYTNLGKNLTKGISYKIEDSQQHGLDKKVLLIYDIPDFFSIDTNYNNKQIGLYRIKQYPGFLIDLSSYNDLDDYMKSTFSKSSRYKLNKYKKRLEGCFDIRYKMFHGEITKVEYDGLFAKFKLLLEKRFLDKQTRNNNLDAAEWSFYEDVAYSMIIEKKASLFVIYNKEEPIGVTLNYFSEDILFDAITVFDIDYAKFNVGSATIMKQIEWCLAKKIKILDFSKGYFDYKERWGNKKYDFEYHIYYDKKSFLANSLAYSLKTFFLLKQLLRDKHVNEKLHKLTFMLKNKNVVSKQEAHYTFVEIEQEFQRDKLIKIRTDSDEFKFLKKMVFDFLYLNLEKFSDLKTYRLIEKGSHYLLEGKSKKMLLQIDDLSKEHWTI